MPLMQFTTSCPPGREPHITHYPLRLYLEKIRLWWRLTDLRSDQIGPAVAGRLAGCPFNIAMAVQVPDANGNILTGDTALSYEGSPADEVNGIPHTDIGLRVLLRALQRAYGAEDQAVHTSVMDQFEALRRTSQMTLLEYLSEFSCQYSRRSHLVATS